MDKKEEKKRSSNKYDLINSILGKEAKRKAHGLTVYLAC
jgi:hypothetical protein